MGYAVLLHRILQRHSFCYLDFSHNLARLQLVKDNRRRLAWNMAFCWLHFVDSSRMSRNDYLWDSSLHSSESHGEEV